MSLPIITDPVFYAVSIRAVPMLGMAAFRKDFDKALLKFLVPFALLGTVIGTLLFNAARPSTRM